MMADIENGKSSPLILKSNVPEENQCEQTDKFNCGICYEDFNKGEVELKMLDKCHHTFCADCFKETFRALIEDQSKHHMLKCP